MTTAAVTAGSPRAWVLACRPATLIAGVVPVMVGTAVAWSIGGFRAFPALAALLGAVLIQVGTNLTNDLFDFRKGADDTDRIGPTRSVQAGLLTERQVAFGAALAFGGSVLAGVYLGVVAGPGIILLGVVSIAAGVAYTAGPLPLAYVGMGDVFVLAFFGFAAVCGTVFVQAQTVPASAWWASAPIGAIATAILVVNNLRDRHTDARANKRTLAVRFGRRFSIGQYVVLLVSAYAVPPAMLGLGLVSAWVLLPLLSAPFALVLGRRVATDEGPALNPSLGATARLLLLYGALFAVGLAA